METIAPGQQSMKSSLFFVSVLNVVKLSFSHMLVIAGLKFYNL